MIIPWRVDVPQDNVPFINWAIIAGAVIVFVFQIISVGERRARLPQITQQYANRPVEDLVNDFGVGEKRLKEIEEAAENSVGEIEDYLTPNTSPAGLRENIIKRAILEEYFVWGKIRPFILGGWNLRGLFGHVWLHGGILHLLGNMLFLWIFGNAVCAKIGCLRYFPIYLGLGLVAGIAHLVFTGGNAIGASGAINGVVGMYVVFFPMNEITCYFILFIPLFIRPIAREICLSSIWVILLWLAFDIWGAARGGGHVAYFAHLGGFVGGFAIAILMLKLNLVTMERYEQSLLQVIAERRNPSTDEYKPKYEGYLGMLQKEVQEQPKPLTINIPEPQIASPPVPKTIPLEPVIPKEEFIRFMCLCGKHLKMPAKYAGRMGKCPKCNARLRIPNSSR